MAEPLASGAALRQQQNWGFPASAAEQLGQAGAGRPGAAPGQDPKAAQFLSRLQQGGLAPGAPPGMPYAMPGAQRGKQPFADAAAAASLVPGDVRMRGLSASGDELKQTLDGVDAARAEHLGAEIAPDAYVTADGLDMLTGVDLRLANDGMPDGVPAFDPATSLRLLEASFRCMPQPSDSQVARRGRVRNLVPVPPSFPTAPPPVVENPALFERLDADALFFSFYFQQGTLQQYLAARELKRSNWRFHKKDTTWFARAEEPKVCTDEYEQGAYVYFDFTTGVDEYGHVVGWCQRSREQFIFDYCQLVS